MCLQSKSLDRSPLGYYLLLLKGRMLYFSNASDLVRCQNSDLLNTSHLSTELLSCRLKSQSDFLTTTTNTHCCHVFFSILCVETLEENVRKQTNKKTETVFPDVFNWVNCLQINECKLMVYCLNH